MYTEQIISLWELCFSPLPPRFPYPHRPHQFHFHMTVPMGCCHTQGRKCYFYRWFSFSALGLGNENGITLQAKWNENNFTFPEPHLWSLKVFSFSTQTEMYRQEEEFIFTVCLQSAPIKIALNTPMNSTSDTAGTPSARDRCKADSFLNLLGNFSEETMGCERRKDHSLI